MALQVHFAILHCYETNDTFGGDEPIIRWNGQETWSASAAGDISLDDGDEVNTDHFVLFGDLDPGTVSLTESDYPDADDHLGSYPIRKDELNKSWRRADFHAEGAHYHLDYEVFDG